MDFVLSNLLLPPLVASSKRVKYQQVTNQFSKSWSSRPPTAMTSLWVLLALACITFSLTPSMAWDREGIHLQEESMEDTPYQVARFIFLVVTEEKEN